MISKIMLKKKVNFFIYLYNDEENNYSHFIILNSLILFDILIYKYLV